MKRLDHHDLSAEKFIVGTIVHHGFERITPYGVTHFEITDAERQRVFMTAEALHAQGQPSTFIGISAVLKLEPYQVLSIGSEDAVTILPPVIQDCAARLRACYLNRRASEIGERLKSGDASIDDAQAELERLTRSTGNLASFPEIVDACRLVESDAVTPADVIEGLLHAGSKLVLGGGSKSFKTWSLLDMGISVSTGMEWWGIPTVPGRVLYVNFEIQAAFFAGRIREICLAKGVKLKSGQLDVLNLRGFAADADAILPEITSRMSRTDYALVILDPLYKLLGSRDENASRDMADLMNGIDRLAVRTGAAVAFGSHFAKGNASGKESMDRISGSGVFARDPDSILTMTRHEQEDAFTVEMTLRNHPPQEAFVVRRRHPLMVPDGSLDPAKLKQVGGRKKEVSAEDVSKLLAAGPLTFAEWSDKAESELFISRDTFKRRLRELKASSAIRTSPMEGGKYVLS